jgi:hypothetical protein
MRRLQADWSVKLKEIFTLIQNINRTLTCSNGYNKWKSSFWPVFKIQIVNLTKLKFYQINNNINLKWAF